MEVSTLPVEGRAPPSSGSDDMVHKDEHELTPTQSASTPLVKPRANNSVLLILAAGCALLSDGYQNSLMTMANVVFRTRFGSKVYTSAVSTRISNASLVGAIIGQISVGIICDRIGRKAGVTITTILLVTGAIFATAAYPVGGNPQNMFWWLTVARGATGVGIGGKSQSPFHHHSAKTDNVLSGEYPASSTAASEAANERLGKKHRSQVFILVTNLVLAFGNIVSLSVFMIVLSATGYRNTTDAAGFHKLGIIWRVTFGFGALFPLIIFYFRMLVMNASLYRKTAMRKKVPYMLALKRYWPRLLGTAGVWFIYDFVVFPLNVFSGSIIASILKTPTLLKTAQYQMLLSSIAIPGVFVGVALLPHLGSRKTFMLGFGGFLVLGLIIGCAYDRVMSSTVAAVILLGLISSSGNAGPGNLCGLVSSESYPSALRGQAYGVSAAIGKVGAAIGTQVFTPIQEHAGKRWVFIISAILGLIGIALVYFFIPETTRFDLADEDRAWLQYLVNNGWDGDIGDGSEGVVNAKQALERVREAEYKPKNTDDEESVGSQK